MAPGMRTSSFPGSVEEAMLDLSAAALPFSGSAALRFRPAAGYGNRNYALYVNARRAGAAFVPEGQAVKRPVPVRPGASSLSVHVEDLGDWAVDSYDPLFTARAFEALSSPRLTLSWTAVPEWVERGDSGAAFSAWSMNGAKRFSNAAPVPGWPTRAQWGVALSDQGGTRTLTLYAGAAPVASGSRAGDGTITLAPLNDSGLGGSVNVLYTQDIPLGTVFLEARFPASYQVHYSTSALSFPRAPEATLSDDGRSNRFRFTTPDLAAGAYNAALVPVSDTGIAAAGATPQSVSVPGPPSPPADLAYDSGDASATVIRWTASPTSGATYNIYDGPLGEPVNTLAPAATHGAGSGSLTQTLPAATGFPGVRRVLLRAVSGGVEEKNGALLAIEYDAAGNVVAPRPNVPRVRSVQAASGRTLTVRALYFEADQAAAPQDAQLFLVPLSDPIDYNLPAASVPWGASAAGVREATLTAGALADGYYKVALRAASAAGTPDNGTAWERVYLSNALPPDVSNVSAAASRG